jgi:carboxyl-terminal processing protease
MKHTGKVALSLLLVLLLVVSAAFVRSSDLFFQIKKQLTIFSDVYKEVATQYVDEIGPEELMQKSIRAMLDGLDPYTVLIDEGEQHQMEIISSGSYGGIGIEAGHRGDHVVIIAPREGYPGHRAGLRAGDIIEEVNNVSVRGMSPEEVQHLTVGDPGTTVSLKIRRPGIDESITFELERERIEIKNINYSTRLGENGEFGYIQLARFGQQTAEEVRQELLKMKEGENFDGLILDLRNNPGGLLNEAVELVDKFIEPGVTIVETRGRYEDYNSTMATSEPALFEDLPLIILINNGSASASEIVAGALQDLDRAVVIGENSFGKGLVQTIRPLSYNTSLKITISRYYIPSGRSIQSMDHSGYDSSTDQPVPDSLRRAFQTKNGRVVFDGHGIEPDIHVQEYESSMIDLALQQNNSYFFFISDFIAAENPSESAEIPDDIFDSFINYLMNDQFTFETPVDRHLEAIEQNIENFPEESSAQETLDELKAQLRDFKILQIYDNQETIVRNLRAEWIAQTMGEQRRYSAMLEIDDFVHRAIDILGDSYEYQIVLRP